MCYYGMWGQELGIAVEGQRVFELEIVESIFQMSDSRERAFWGTSWKRVLMDMCWSSTLVLLVTDGEPS